MYDYIIKCRCLRISLLDTRVFCGTQLDTDHELAVSTFRFKIECKRHWNTWQPRKQETILNSTQHHSFITTMKEALVMRQDRNQEDEIVEASWQSLKDALVKAEHGLPDLPLVPVHDWVSKELTNLLRKKSEAWVRLCNTKANNPILPELQQQYNILHRRTNRAAEKVRNHWWSTKAAEDEERMRVAEQNGHGGSLIRELCPLCNHVSKPVAPSILAKNGVDRLTSMSHKLDRMAEHFSDVLNCEKPVDNGILLQIPHAPSSPEAEALSKPLTVAEIIRVLRLLWKGKVPGEDGVSVELLLLGGSAVVEAMKKVADQIWKQESVPADWQKQLIVPILRTRALGVNVIIIVGSPC